MLFHVILTLKGTPVLQINKKKITGGSGKLNDLPMCVLLLCNILAQI